MTMSKHDWYDIRARGNRSAEVFVYGDIGESWSDETVTAKKFVAELGALNVDVLNVRINSIGGSVPDGLAIYNALKRHKASINVSIDGLAASVASLIAMAGDTVQMAANAMIMIHAPWSVVVGNAEEMRDRAELLDKMAQAMATSYARPGGLSQESALALLTDGVDHWYSAEEAKSAGIVDTITEAMQMAASLDVSRFRNRFSPAAAAASTQKGKTMAEQVNTPAAPNSPAAPIQAVLPEPEALTIDLDEIKTEALKDDNNRRMQIEAIAKPWIERADVRAAVKQAHDGMKSVETFRAEFLRMLGRNSQALGGGLIMTVEDEADKFRAGVTAGMMIRAGLVPNDRSNEFRGYSLMELCRASLQRNNISTKSMDKMQVVAAAFTHSTSDFDNLLADVANKSMQKGYEESEETFQRWTSVGTLPDFKVSKRVDLNTFPALAKVEPGAEYRYVTVGDRGEPIQLATYGSLFSINRQAIINDDLGAFTRVPNKMGRAAIRTVGNLVYAVLTSNPNMADAVALFHANHGNLPTGAVIGTSSVDAMDAAMAKQTDATGNTLNISLAYLIVPRALKGLALQVANSEFEVGLSSTTKNNTIPNWMRGNFEVVADARLDAASASNWFGAANPNIHDTIEVAYLDGNTAPQLEQQGGWTVDGVDFKVRIDAAVKALDWRGLAKNPN
jgi:ATP-dependent Clp endopeptidase proteolytic subunit ClpP